MNYYTITFILTLFLGGGWLWATQVPVEQATYSRTPLPSIGHPAPDFTLTTLDGNSFDLSTHNKPIVLNFWATWCGPCRRELPALQATTERYEGEVLVVGVDQGEDAQIVQSYVDELGLTFVVPMDMDHAVADSYNVRGMPTTFFIDSEGIIQQTWSGEMNQITLAEGIAKILD